MTHILDTDINKLKQDQKKALKEHIISVFEDIKRMMMDDNIKGIDDKYIIFSGGGDGWGEDNYFINFSWNKNVMDIADVLNMLSELNDDDFRIEGRYL